MATKIYELKNSRQTLLDDAEKAVNGGNMDEYNAKMSEVTKINDQITALETLQAEQGKFDDSDERMKNMLHGIEDKKKDDSLTDKLDIVRSGNEYIQAFGAALKRSLIPGNISTVGGEEFTPLKNALSIGGGDPVGADGGFLVPIEFDNMIHRKMKEFVRLSDYFKIETVSGYSGWRAVETTASRRPLQLINEGAPINPNDQPVFKKVDYVIKKYSDRLPITREELNDTTTRLLEYVADWYAAKHIMTENALLIGLLNKLTAKSFTKDNELAELKGVLNKELNTAISRNSSLLVNGNSYDFLDNLTDANKRGLLVPDPSALDVFRFKNRPVVIMDEDLLPGRTVTAAGASKGDYDPIYIGCFKAFGTLFRRKALEMKLTYEGGQAWVNDTPEIRVICRMDAQIIDEGAAVRRELFTPAV